KVAKYIFFAMIIFTWLAFFMVFFFRKDDKILKTVILSDETRQVYTAAPDEFELYQFFPNEFMSQNGDIQLFVNVYTPNTEEIEIGVRLSASALDDDAYKQLHFVITDNKGNSFTPVKRVSRNKNINISENINFIYSYERISFSGIYLDLDKNIIYRDKDYQTTSEIEEDIKNREISLLVYKNETDKDPYFSIILYNDNMYIKDYYYEIPDSKYLN
ncbi:hypothetical protein LJB90_03830, partial [Eubacteriales bacterium OttesenSCG-928-G02]|nr:hypothetical protein [Eubacteriales bacterium OttesenSCG-928-G02]